eukprot:3922798-Amphidinium_carterae.1
MRQTGMHSIKMFMTRAVAEMLSCLAALLEVDDRVDEMSPIPDNAIEAGRVIPFYVTYDEFATVPSSSNTQVFVFKTSKGNPTE